MRFRRSRTKKPSGDAATPDEIAAFMALHAKLCDLIAQSNPNIAAVLRKQINEQAISAWPRTEFDRRRTDIKAQLERLCRESETLSEWERAVGPHTRSNLGSRPQGSGQPVPSGGDRQSARGSDMSQIENMRRDVVQWAPQMASMFNFMIHHYPDDPQHSQYVQTHKAAMQLSDPKYVRSLSVAKLTAKHELLKAFIADKKKRDEESERLAADIEQTFKDLG